MHNTVEVSKDDLGKIMERVASKVKNHLTDYYLPAIMLAILLDDQASIRRYAETYASKSKTHRQSLAKKTQQQLVAEIKATAYKELGVDPPH